MRATLLVPLALTLLAFAAPAAADAAAIDGVAACTTFTHGHGACRTSDGELWVVCIEDPDGKTCVAHIH